MKNDIKEAVEQYLSEHYIPRAIEQEVARAISLQLPNLRTELRDELIKAIEEFLGKKLKELVPKTNERRGF